MATAAHVAAASAARVPSAATAATSMVLGEGRRGREAKPQRNGGDRHYGFQA